MANFRIPADIKAATKSLIGIEALLTATQWQKSAIVRAFCYKGKNRFDEGSRSNESGYSLSDFAELGIVGLTTRNAVTRYYDSWDLSGLADPEPGKDTAIPNQDFPSAEELKSLRERQEAIETFAREVSEGVSQLVEYDQEYRYLLPDYAVDQLVMDAEGILEFLADRDQEALQKLLAEGEGMVQHD